MNDLMETRLVIDIIRRKMLPMPNKYGSWVKVDRYNEVMEEIIKEIQKLEGGDKK